MKNTLILVILIITSSFTVFAQGGSNYSSLGIGDLNYYGTANFAGNDGLAVSYTSNTALNPRNPALWSHINTTRLDAGYLFSQNIVSNGTTSIWQNSGAISGFNASFCIDTAKGITFGLGIMPKSKLNYYISQKINIQQDGMNLTGQSLYQGKGGLNDLFLGLSGRFFNFIEVGGETYYTFGLMSRIAQSLFTEDKTAFSPGVITNDYFKGWGAKAGVNFRIGKSLSIGACWEAAQKLDYEHRVTFTGISSSTDSTVKDTLQTTLPQSFGLGFSYKIGKFLIGADFINQDFSKLNYNVGEKSFFTNTKQYIVGLTYFGNERETRDYYKRISYKLGFAYRDLYYNVRGNQISEMSFSLGLRFPSTQYMYYDAGFIFGQRGTTNNSLVKETFGKMYINVTIGEVWFKPFIRDYGKED